MSLSKFNRSTSLSFTQRLAQIASSTTGHSKLAVLGTTSTRSFLPRLPCKNPHVMQMLVSDLIRPLVNDKLTSIVQVVVVT
jgi:hypothetical protein